MALLRMALRAVRVGRRGGAVASPCNAPPSLRGMAEHATRPQRTRLRRSLRLRLLGSLGEGLCCAAQIRIQLVILLCGMLRRDREAKGGVRAGGTGERRNRGPVVRGTWGWEKGLSPGSCGTTALKR
eukprot:2808756-Prymnesium_polylepis.1